MRCERARTAARRLAEEVGPLAGRAVAVKLPNRPDVVATMVVVRLAGRRLSRLDELPRNEVGKVLHRQLPL
jgi:hypothetical protein